MSGLLKNEKEKEIEKIYQDDDSSVSQSVGSWIHANIRDKNSTRLQSRMESALSDILSGDSCGSS